MAGGKTVGRKKGRKKIRGEWREVGVILPECAADMQIGT
jgi:hypothetical protein